MPSTDDAIPLATRVRWLSGQDNWRTHPVGGLPPVVMADGPHGVRRPTRGQLGIGDAVPATCFPTAAALGATWDEELLERVGAALGREARARDVDVLLGPGLNIKRHPAGGRNFEYFSEDPLLSGRLAAALVRGVQSEGVGACAKHFAVNNQEANRMVVDVVVDERTLRELYLPAFEHVVRAAGPWTVMCAYNRVNGTYCSDDRRLLTDILREEWGFDGVVMSDWAATNDRVAGLRAGLDLEMPGSGGAFDDEVLAAVRRGGLDPSRVDTAVARLHALGARAADCRAAGAGPDDPDAAHELARQAAAAATVLLSNDGVLPLPTTAGLAVIGRFAAEPRYQGSGSSRVTPTRMESALEQLRARAATSGVDELHYAPGYHADGTSDPTLLREAAEAAARADVAVVFVGLPEVYESEGFDRDTLALPPAHDELVEQVLAANPRTVVVLANGAPVLLPWADRVSALVETYLGGQAGGGAIADVLLGEAEPAGRLAESFPSAAEDLPADRDFPGSPTQVVYREGLFVGYRFHTSAGVPARFPFGHGGSYTRITWSDAEVQEHGDGVRVQVTLANVGERRGSEVVQVYVRHRDAAVVRPDRELRGFARLWLDPGEQAAAVVDLDARAFAYWDVSAAGWRVDAGDYDVLVAASATDIRATLPWRVGDVTARPPAPAPVWDDTAFEAALGRPVPTPDPALPLHRNSRLDDLAQTGVGRALRAVLLRASARGISQGGTDDPATRRMMEEMVRTSPLRALALFGGGRRSLRGLDRLVWLCNATARVRRGRHTAG